VAGTTATAKPAVATARAKPIEVRPGRCPAAATATETAVAAVVPTNVLKADGATATATATIFAIATVTPQTRGERPWRPDTAAAATTTGA
jgi:hypothetical protein